MNFRVSTQCPWCEQPNTLVEVAGRAIVGVRHSTMAADLACLAIKVDVEADVKVGKHRTGKLYRPKLTMDYLALARALEDGQHGRRLAQQRLCDEAFGR